MTIKHRIITCLVVTAVIFLGLEIRLWNIQVIRHSPIKKTAVKQFKHKIYLNPDRGNIYDRNGDELALDINVDSVFAVPSEISNPRRTSRKLAGILGLNESSLAGKLRKRSSFAWVKRKVGTSLSMKVRKLNLNGIYLLQEKKRFYPENDLACHIIGCVGIDSQGLSGIEKNFDKFLKTAMRRAVRVTDAFGRNVITTDDVSKPEKECCDVVLTVDKYIQHVVEVELRKAYLKSKASRATIVVQDPATGEILALANFPGFNGNKSLKYASRYLNNPAITNVYEPGSTFKIIAAAAVLEKNLVRPKDRFYCENGTWVVGNYPIRDHEKEGWLNFKQIIIKSSNIGMAKIGEKLGKIGLYEYTRKFGFGNYTGIDLPGESSGILRKMNKWSSISLGRISFGQEIGVTAIQLVSAFSSIANKGRLMQPRIVRCVLDSDGNKVEEFRPVAIRRVVSHKTVNLLTKMLIGVVEEGTGVAAGVEGYEVAGKTGTAQKYDKKTGGYCSVKYTASFAGFIPAYKPRVTILVIVDEPEGVYYGGTVAAPVFSRVAQKIMEYYSIPWDEYKFARTVTAK